MIYPEKDELNQYPRYILTLLAAERARLLREGATPLVPVDGQDFNPLSVALREIEEGKVKPLVLAPDRVEVLVEGSENAWSVPRDIKELHAQQEEEPEEEVAEAYEEATRSYE
jgi:DNA-directed RNA polymerase omega subunit